MNSQQQELLELLCKNVNNDYDSEELKLVNLSEKDIDLLNSFGIEFYSFKATATEPSYTLLNIFNQKNVKIYKTLKDLINYNTSGASFLKANKTDLILILELKMVFMDEKPSPLFENIFGMRDLIKLISKKLAYYYDSINDIMIFHSNNGIFNISTILNSEDYLKDLNINNLLRLLSINNKKFFKHIVYNIVNEVIENNSEEKVKIDFFTFLSILNKHLNETMLMFHYLVCNVHNIFDDISLEVAAEKGDIAFFCKKCRDLISQNPFYLEETQVSEILEQFEKMIQEDLHFLNYEDNNE